MQLFEMQGLLAGKCLPGDMKVNETHAEYFLRKFNQVNELAAENSSLRLTIDNIVKALGLGDGPVSQQVIELVTGLTAENVVLKAAFKPSDIPSELTDVFGDTAVIEHDSAGDNQGREVSWSWVGNQEDVIKAVLSEVASRCETPATDAAIAELKAQGIDWLIETVSPEWLESYVQDAKRLAATLRAGGKES